MFENKRKLNRFKATESIIEEKPISDLEQVNNMVENTIKDIDNPKSTIDIKFENWKKLRDLFQFRSFLETKE